MPYRDPASPPPDLVFDDMTARGGRWVLVPLMLLCAVAAAAMGAVAWRTARAPPAREFEANWLPEALDAAASLEVQVDVYPASDWAEPARSDRREEACGTFGQHSHNVFFHPRETTGTNSSMWITRSGGWIRQHNDSRSFEYRTGRIPIAQTQRLFRALDHLVRGRTGTRRPVEPYREPVMGGGSHAYFIGCLDTDRGFTGDEQVWRVIAARIYTAERRSVR